MHGLPRGSMAFVLTLPNVLTLLRILAVPFFAIAIWYGLAVEALALFVGAALTDLLDGYIARRFNQRSDIGAILDPAADKLLMTTAFVLLALPSSPVVARIPAWVSILAVTRDALISLFALLAFDRFNPSRLQPSLLGKLTTAVELVAISLGLLVNALGVKPWTGWVVPWAYYLVAALVMASGIHYFFRATHQHKGS